MHVFEVVADTSKWTAWCKIECLLIAMLLQETDSKEEKGFKTEAANTLQELVRTVDQWETQQMLGGQYDKLGVVLSIQVCSLYLLRQMDSMSN